MRADKGNLAEKLAHTIKQLEACYEPVLPVARPYVVRLDGVAFRTYTSNMQKPFDAGFTRAMIGCTMDLVGRTGARTGFCQSDEITLVFASETGTNDSDAGCKQMLYSGRVQKIASVLAGLASISFSRQMLRTNPSTLSTSGASFDARAFSCPEDATAMHAVYWRHAFDCRRNAINSIAHAHFPHRDLHRAGLGVVLRKLSERDIQPSQFPSENIYGVFVKRIKVPHLGFNPKTGEHMPTTRTRLQGRVFDWLDADEGRRTDLVLSKLWPTTLPDNVLKIIDEVPPTVKDDNKQVSST